MLTKNKIKILYVSLLLCFGLIFLSLGMFFNSTYAESEKFIYTGALESSYAVGDVVEIPSATVDGEAVSVKITLPDGKLSSSTSLTLKQSGYYKIEYYIKKGNTVLKDYKSFTVKGNLFNSSDNVSQEYFVNETYNISGALFNIPKDESITYADVVDLNDFNGPNDTLFKLYHYPSTFGQPDITQFTVTLTDAYDDTNTVTVRYKQSPDTVNLTTITYADVTFLGDKYVAYYKSKSGPYYTTGLVGMYDESYKPLYATNYGAYVDNPKFGTHIRGSFTGGTAEKPSLASNGWSGLGFDPDTNIIYLVGGRDRNVLADLKNADVFGEPFKGFTDGKVKITIQPTVFSQGSWNVLFTEFAGKKIVEESLTSFEPSYDPIINIDFNGYSENNVPSVKKGSYYQPFSAKGYDFIDGDLDVDVSVYYGYKNLNKVQVSVSDGKFLAKHAGTYTVVYTCTNSSGNTTVKTLDIQSIDDVGPLSVDLVNEIDYSIDYYSGELIKVFDDFIINNAYGLTNFSAMAVLKTDNSVKFALDVDNNYSFKPIFSGEYVIKLTVSDYSDSKVIEKELNVVPSPNVHYEINGFLPDYIIKNGRYDLGVVRAFTLDTATPTEKDVVMGVEKDGNITWLQTSDIYAEEVYINDDNTLKLVYKPNIDTVASDNYFVKEIPVIDTGLYTKTMDLSKYFVTTVGSFTATRSKDNIDYKLNKLENGKASMDFIQTLICNPFTLELAPIVGDTPYVAFNSIDVYLTNPADEEEFIKVSMKQQSGGWYFVVNDGRAVKFANSWGAADDYYYVNFYEDTCKLVINGVYDFSDVTFYGSDKLVNFPYGVTLRLDFFGPENATGIMLKNVCSQKFNNRTNDIVEPSIDYAHDKNAGEKSLNEIITVEPFSAFDVLSPSIKANITVTYTTEDGLSSVIWKSIDGVNLEEVDASKGFKFKVSEYGSYEVSIYAYDPMTKNNDAWYSYSVYVVNYTKPVVSITDCQSTAKVGDQIKLPKFTVDISDYKWYLSIKAPNSMMSFTNSETAETAPFKFDQKGVYTVTLVVYDSNMNMSSTVYTVNVK